MDMNELNLFAFIRAFHAVGLAEADPFAVGLLVTNSVHDTWRDFCRTW